MSSGHKLKEHAPPGSKRESPKIPNKLGQRLSASLSSEHATTPSSHNAMPGLEPANIEVQPLGSLQVSGSTHVPARTHWPLDVQAWPMGRSQTPSHCASLYGCVQLMPSVVQAGSGPRHQRSLVPIRGQSSSMSQSSPTDGLTHALLFPFNGSCAGQYGYHGVKGSMVFDPSLCNS